LLSRKSWAPENLGTAATRKRIKNCRGSFTFGFNLSLLGSERYVLERLGRLSSAEVDKLRELFVKNKHPRFKKEFAASRHMPMTKHQIT
jgi:hypothetical protein